MWCLKRRKSESSLTRVNGCWLDRRDPRDTNLKTPPLRFVMSAFNTMLSEQTCPQSGTPSLWRVQFKYGEVWQHEYRVGDQLVWGKNSIGKPGARRVVVDAVAEPCTNCGYDPGDFYVLVENDRIAAA